MPLDLMKGDLKPGCLAIVIKSQTGMNLGKLVELDRLVTPGELVKGFTYNRLAWLVTGSDLTVGLGGNIITGSNYSLFSSDALMLIGTPGEHVTTEKEEEVFTDAG